MWSSLIKISAKTKLSLITFLTITFLANCSEYKKPLEWNENKEYRWAQLAEYDGERSGFDPLGRSSTGIDFINKLSDEDIVENRHLLNGSGVAAGDVDGDGLTDLYFAGLNNGNRLYKNEGSLNFTDITDKAGVAHEGYFSTGVAFADVDGDGDLDLLVTTNSEGTFCYLNDGTGKFERNELAGLSRQGSGSTSMALADIDGDGDLDLYVANYKQKSVRDQYNAQNLRWERVVTNEGGSYRINDRFKKHYTLIQRGNVMGRYEYGESDQLYLNNGDGNFEKAAESKAFFKNEEGNALELQKDWGLSVKFQDINGDGLPDMYVCNDFWTPDRIWINQGEEHFKPLDKLSVRSYSLSCMDVDFSDIDRDGHQDIFTTEMLSLDHSRRMRQISTNKPVPIDSGLKTTPQYMRNMLYHNRGDNTYEEIAQYSNVDATEWSWTTIFMDINLDGYEDLFITTGNAYDVQDADVADKIENSSFSSQEEAKRTILSYPSLELRNMVMMNNRDLTFSEQSEKMGLKEQDISHGAATADLDNDGDLDVVVNRLNEEARIYENVVNAPRIAVRLKGESPNTRAVGARLILHHDSLSQQDEINSGGNYLSSSEPMAVFAAPYAGAYSLEIKWRSGKQSRIPGIKPNRIYEIYESDIEKKASGDSLQKETPRTIFDDRSGNISFLHRESSFEDFKLQPLLPFRLSQEGPGIGAIDYNDDGMVDLLIGNGKGGRTGIYAGRGSTAGSLFNRERPEILSDSAKGDQTSILGWKQEGEVHLLVGSANYERGSAGVPSAFHYTLRNGNVVESSSLEGIFSTTGPMAIADIDIDGDLDLFTGGSFVPGHYPTPANSRLFMNEDGTFKSDRQNSDIFRKVGSVKGAVFSDYDRDGDQDLFMTTDWGSIKAFNNAGGNFREVTKTLGLDRYKGLWRGIASGDFNNDGKPDLVAGNWGLNSQYRPSALPKIYYGDLDQDRRIELIEAYYDDKLDSMVPMRNLTDLAEVDETIKSRIKSHEEYGSSSLSEVMGKNPEEVPMKEVTTLESMVFINDGRSFTARPLPTKAQLSPAFNVSVADFNHDGNEDILLTQNFFETPRKISRSDAGRALWLKGDGQGHFTPLSANKSGVKVYGEQRGAALGDFNGDRRLDMAITQNEGPLKLYINRGEKQGIKVRLTGDSQNEWAIGSSVRLIYSDGTKGPLRELQAGSGYWSQNSIIPILGYQKEIAQLKVNWFDGTGKTVEISEEDLTDEIVISY